MSFKKENRKILICAGGTGGHIIPAITLGKNLTGYDVFYICGNRDIERKIYKTFDLNPTVLDIKSFNPFSYILKFPSLLFDSLKIVSSINPRTVMITGNYISFSVGLAALLFGKKIIILEQDAIIGKTNKIFSFFSYKIFTGFPAPFRYVNNKKIIHIGHILRENIFEFSKDNNLIIDSTKKTILIFGGSQGAKNVAKKVLDFLCPLNEIYNIILVAGNHYDDFKKYKNITVLPFYENMGYLYSISDIVISRSGAISVAEIKALNKKVIFIPFESASNKEQIINIKKINLDPNRFIVIREKKLSKENLISSIEKLLSIKNENKSFYNDLYKQIGMVKQYV
ncbi:MAG: UDP-N-acetylglucosamine--N-acetylmuramyl-(pentapeptide) pyrophosphoryl-undecaprenol N-acetylglucosamine transferase [candidate division WOR-3 bacterium]|jgi:UDP-N-acetylglucosamine--N-acetylmuramyl-(pentapeptide) pyrophosphoryl-undecaprenol N-acetylglucosamine transferase